MVSSGILTPSGEFQPFTLIGSTVSWGGGGKNLFSVLGDVQASPLLHGCYRAVEVLSQA
jgi:hypothetical protein